jgi:two-component system response regulator CpxR
VRLAADLLCGISCAKGLRMQALLIDDDAELCAMMQEYFTQAGHELDTAHDGHRGLRRMLEESYDVVLLDVMLPAINGFSLLQQIRRSRTVPVIMLTARVECADRIAGLNRGADDYVTKPFDPDELLARIKAVLRRAIAAAAGDPMRRYDDVEINVPARAVRVAGEPIELTALEFDILELLSRNAGRPVSRDEISEKLLRRASSSDDRALDVHVSHLRTKLGARALIRTVRGMGYVFAAGA